MADKSERATRGMNKTGFGQRLKRERELRGVSRDEICSATRIGTRYLEALENEQWEILPGGIFNRGFVRAVARFLGLDEDDLVADYDLAINEQSPPIEPRLSPPVPREPPRTRVVRLSLLLGALCVTVLLGTGWLDRRQHYETPHPATNAPSAITSAGKAEGTSPSSDENASRVSSAALAAADGSSRAVNQVLQLKIEAGKETSVSVSADGSRVFEGSMIAGQSRTFTAQDAIDISAKDAGALLLELNGQTLAPLGPPGQPGNVTLTRSDLKATGGGAD
jgi:cytoskeleton protein RodZ